LGESVQFIEALSGEFEIMSDIAEKKLIPIEQEIELCQKHIQIMRYRKEVNYIFEAENIAKASLRMVLHIICLTKKINSRWLYDLKKISYQKPTP